MFDPGSHFPSAPHDAGRDGPSDGGAPSDGKAGDLLCLLKEVQRALHDDPARAHLGLDRACRLLRENSFLAASPCPILPSRSPVDHPSPTGGLAGWQVRKVMDFVERRLSRNLVTGELAMVADLSPGHFCRAFKVSMGETPRAYIIRQRIRRAQMLMLDTRQSLSQIASACGLADQAHLTRLFKRLVGTTPLLWRRAWQLPAVAAR